MRYQVRPGDSPAIIAHRHGLKMSSLFNANRHKPVTVVRGRPTWSALGLGEQINIPVGVGYLGANATIRNGSRGPDVTLWQTIVGVKADGIFGPNTEKATRAWQAARGLAADGIVGPKTWAAALASGPPVAALPITLPSLPGIPSLPIAIPGVTPPQPAPVTQAPIPVAVAPIAAAAVSALSAIDPCLSQNVSMVCAAQAALGVTVDGKYGNDTAAAVRRALGSAPPACGTQSWWGPKGQSRCGGPVMAPSLPSPSPVAPPPVFLPEPTPFIPPPVSIPSPVSPPVSMPAPSAPSAPSAPGTPQPVVMAPEPKKGLSTGMMVAGAVGAAAIVGLIAVAASGKKITSRTTISRGPARRRKSTSKRKKRK